MLHRRDKDTQAITGLILSAAEKARNETGFDASAETVSPVNWPVTCVVGPGLEGAIACESRIGYVNGSKGWLIYRGYDIFDLCAYSTFEEVSYLLLYGKLPNKAALKEFTEKLVRYRNINYTIRLLMNYPIEGMNAMAALRLGVDILRHETTYADKKTFRVQPSRIINTDEDSIPMETKPMGEKDAIYRFKPEDNKESCLRLISGLATIAAAIARLKKGLLPVEPDLRMSHAANFLYMMTDKKPTPLEEGVMDTSLILHADHGMNASTFAAMVVASTLSDIYFSVGAGISALNGPLHGGANELVLYDLKEIGDPANVKNWVGEAVRTKRKIMGFGHRVYKSYDPRARVLGPIAEYLVSKHEESKKLLEVAKALEKEVMAAIGAEKKVFPNVDFFSGIVYSCLGIPAELFTPVFAVSRVSGWTARVSEYLENNRIFRPRAMYIGEFGKKYVSVEERK